MSDQFNQPPHGWSPFEFVLGIGGVLSPWWQGLVHAFDATMAGITFYGGALLVGIQLWRYASHKIRKWRGLAILALVWALSPLPAEAHHEAQWIADGKYTGMTGVQCCGPTDCQRIDERAIKRTVEGWEVEGVLFRESDFGRGLHASETRDFWICRLSPDDESDGPGRHHGHPMGPAKPHCLFVRMEGV